MFWLCTASPNAVTTSSLPVRYAMTHHIIHRCTDWLGEAPVSERGGVGIVFDYLLMHNEIDFICCYTDLKDRGDGCVGFDDTEAAGRLVVILFSLSDCVRLTAVHVWLTGTLWQGLWSARGSWSLCSPAILGPVQNQHSQAAQCAWNRGKMRTWKIKSRTWFCWTNWTKMEWLIALLKS